MRHSRPRGIPGPRDLVKSRDVSSTKYEEYRHAFGTLNCRSDPQCSTRREGREIAIPRADKTQQSGDWIAVRYEDRPPRWGETRADDYHASRLFPNYQQFSRTKTGPTMVDTQGRQYQVADGIDRLEDQSHGLVASGSPYLVEPSFMKTTGLETQSLVFSELGGRGAQTSSYTFRLLPEGRVFPDSVKIPHVVSRGAQLLYVRIPIRERKKNPDLGLPILSEKLEMVHIATGTKVTGRVEEVDGFQFPSASTGSVRVDNLEFLIDSARLAL